MATRKQINIPISQKRNSIIFTAMAAALIFCGFLLYIRPGAKGPNSMVEGGIGEFSIYFALLVFAIYIAFLSKDMMHTNYIVSIGDQGIFDRRISTDWIPWSAIHSVAIVDQASQKSLLFKISQSEDSEKRTRRMMISSNTIGKHGMPNEFLVEAGTLRVGSPHCTTP